MPSFTVYPVQVLRIHILALEAAIATCLADPGIRPVHRLRTETRRVEALLFLLDLLPDLPKHKKQATRLRQVLRKLRRDAGEVRDLDVHRKMLEAFAAAEETAGTQPSSPAPPAETAGSPAPPSQTLSTAENTAEGKPQSADMIAKQARRLADTAGKDAEQGAASNLHQSALTLRRHMGEKRDAAATALQQTLGDRQRRASRVAEQLLTTLKAAEELPLPGATLLKDAEIMLTRDGLLRTNIAKLSRDELHSVRKAAKAARYVAESLPEDPAVAEAARRFEALQEAGGQWHDAWQLARAARRRFGKDHELTMLYREERNRKLVAYREALRGGLSGRRKAERVAGKNAPAASQMSRRRSAALAVQSVPGTAL